MKLKSTIKFIAIVLLSLLTINVRGVDSVGSRITDINGSPAWELNGKPIFFDAMSSYDKFAVNPTNSPTLEAFGKAGIHIYSQHLGDGTYWWVGPNQYDYTRLDRMFHHIIALDSQAKFIVRIRCFAAMHWWYKAHLDERAMALKMPGNDPIDGYPTISFASKLFRQDLNAALRKLVQHIEASDYADRVIAYQPCGGRNAEWIYWSYGGGYVKPELGDLLADFNPQFLAEFRDWLQRKYQTVENLRAAWRQPGVTFASATLAGEERWRFSLGGLRDPAKDQPGIDTVDFIWWIIGDFSEMTCKTIKEASTRESIPCGIFSGWMYSMDFPRALESPYFDFFLCPPMYEDRDIGGTSTMQTFTLASIARRGKLFIDESDIRTFQFPTNSPYSRLQNLRDTLMVLRREFASALCNNTGIMWLNILDTPVYSNPAIMKDLARMRGIGELSLGCDRHSAAEIAVIVSQRSRLYANTPVTAYVADLNRIGAPFDAYTIEDFGKIPVGQYKLFVFACDSYLTEPQRRWIESLKSNGRTLLFQYATGLFNDDGLSVDAMSKLTGMNVELEKATEPREFRILSGADAMLKGLPSNFQNQDPFNVDCRPTFGVTDPAATILGHSEASGRTVFAMRKYPQWISVFYSYPSPQSKILRAVARAAGVHIYLETDDAFYANHSFVAIHAREAGSKTISLPQGTQVVDVFRSALIGENVNHITIDLAAGETRLFALGKLADLFHTKPVKKTTENTH